MSQSVSAPPTTSGQALPPVPEVPRYTLGTDTVRTEIHVRPAASATAVGGEYDGAVVVRVAAPADRGRATSSALRAMALALGVPPSAVTLVRGATSRRKLIEIEVRGHEKERVDGALMRLRRDEGA